MFQFVTHGVAIQEPHGIVNLGMAWLNGSNRPLEREKGRGAPCPLFLPKSARLPVDGESADMPQGWCCFPTGVKRKGRCVMRVSIGCGFFQARFPVEDVKEADALEKG